MTFHSFFKWFRSVGGFACHSVPTRAFSVSIVRSIKTLTCAYFWTSECLTIDRNWEISRQIVVSGLNRCSLKQFENKFSWELLGNLFILIHKIKYLHSQLNATVSFNYVSNYVRIQPEKVETVIDKKLSKVHRAQTKVEKYSCNAMKRIMMTVMMHSSLRTNHQLPSQFPRKTLKCASVTAVNRK